jgi:CheY-like chemotaxis protein
MKYKYISLSLASCFTFNIAFAQELASTPKEEVESTSSYWKPIILGVTSLFTLVAAHRLWNPRFPPSPRRLEGTKILVAEDTPLQARMVKARLERLGAEVVVKDNAADTIEAASAQRFDVVLLDNHMPQEPGGHPVADAGLFAATRIRTNSDSSTPVLMHSSSRIGSAELRRHNVQGQLIKGETKNDGYVAEIAKVTSV